MFRSTELQAAKPPQAEGWTAVAAGQTKRAKPVKGRANSELRYSPTRRPKGPKGQPQKKKNYLFLLLLLSSLLWTSCRSVPKGWTSYHQGKFWYKHSSQQQRKGLRLPKEGDQLEISYSIWKGDSLLLSSADQAVPVLVEMPSAEAHNLFTEALSLMAEGDSLEVLVLAKAAADILGPYAAEFEEKERVRFGYRLKTLKSKAQLAAEIEAERARIAQRRQWVQAELAKDSSLSQLAGQAAEGIRFEKLKSTKGPKLQLGQLAQIQYICLLPNGDIIDDSFLNMRPIWVELGDLKTIRGWSLALEEFAEGEQGLIYLPSALAYGALGNPPFVPPHSPLIFYIEVLTTK